MSYVRADSGSLSYWVGVPLIFLAAMTEASVLPLFRVFGLQPNLVLMILTAWIMVRGQDEVLYLIPLGGIFLGLAEGAPLGAAVLAFAPVAVLYELRGARLDEGQLLVTLLFAVAVTLVYHIVYFCVFALQGEASSFLVGAGRVILVSSILNAIVLLPVYGLIWAASGDRRRAAFA